MNRSEFEKTVYENKFRVLLSQADIQDRIGELGKAISEDYRDKQPIFIGVLNGGFIFMADLIRRVEIDLEIDFIRISSYGDQKKSSGKIRLEKDINAEIKDRHVIIVEDIIDTGLSIQFLRERFQSYGPASLAVVTLLYKKEKVRNEINIDYVGFTIPDHFVVGYGLDHKQILRNLPAVYVLE
ncbi:hypoxanthine phosphoribosyltransferase [candidate division KSB1 bacterium]|nr:hypoxanthine phosphoribosyltransferase [candidate division KSB1 bacterium]